MRFWCPLSLLGATLAVGDPAGATEASSTPPVEVWTIEPAGDPGERVREALESARAKAADGDWTAALQIANRLFRQLDAGHWAVASVRDVLLCYAAQANRLEDLATEWIPRAGADAFFASSLAELEGFRGNEEARTQWFSRAVGLAPDDAALRMRLATAWESQGELELAIQQVVEARRLRPVDPACARTLARLRVNAGEIAEARRLAAESLELAGDSTAAARKALFRELGLREDLGKVLRGEATSNPGHLPTALALADFLLEEGKSLEALEVLQPFWDDPEDALQVARSLHDRGFSGPAEEWAAHAAAASPQPGPALVLLADLLEARGRPQAALAVLEEFAPPGVGEIPEDLDRRLFSAFRRVEEPSHPVRGTKAFARSLAGVARESGAPAAAWLRAVRWHRWCGEDYAAIELLEEARASGHSGPEILGALADALEDTGQIREAIATLELVETPDPGIPLRIAQLEAADGRPEDAISRLQKLSARGGDSPELHAGLAAAQEAAGNSYGALPHWKTALTESPPSKRIGLARSLLDCYARLGQARTGLEWLVERVGLFPEGASQHEFVRMAAVHARENALSSLWDTMMNSLAVSDPTWLVHAPDVPAGPAAGAATDPDSVRAARDAATAAGNLDLALTLARRLTHAPSATADDFAALAGVIEQSGDREAAVQTWLRIPRLFPGDFPANVSAARALKALGAKGSAEEVWRSAASIGKIPPDTRLELAEAASRRGEKSLALSDLDALLAQYPPDRLSRDAPPPPPRLLDPATFEEDSPGAAPIGYRLRALHAVGGLFNASPQRLQEIERRATGGPTDLSWAIAGAGLDEQALDAWLTEDRAIRDSDRPALVALALAAAAPGKAAEFAGTGDWTAAATAFQALMEAGWRPEVGTLGSFFDQAPDHRRQEAAEFLASSGFLRLAEALCDPSGLPAEGRREALFRLAGWQLALRLPDRAAATLDALLADETPLRSLATTGAAALRARYLLEPAASRAEWVSSHRASRSGEASLEDMLLAALSGQESVFEEHALRWLNTRTFRPVADVIGEGAVLESWNLGEWARRLYRSALQSDQALGVLLESRNSRAVLEAALASSRLAAAEPREAVVLAETWRSQGADAQGLVNAAARAAGAGRFKTAQAIYAVAFASAPVSRAVVNQRLALAHHPGSFPEDLLDWFLATSPERRTALGSDCAIRLAEILVNQGRFGEALEVLEAERNPPDPSLAARRALILGVTGDAVSAAAAAAEAVSTGEEPPGSPVMPLLASEPQNAVAAWRAFERSRPSQALRIEALERLPLEAPEILEALGFERVETLLATVAEEPNLAARATKARFEAARALNKLPELQSRLRREWQLTGDLATAESLLRTAVARNDLPAARRITEEFLASPSPKPATLEEWGKFLLEAGYPDLAVRAFEQRDRHGIASHAIALAYAEALWKSGRSAEATAIARAYERAAEIDPALRVSLAAFWVAVDRPHEALANAECPGLPHLVRHRAAPLASAARQILAQASTPPGGE